MGTSDQADKSTSQQTFKFEVWMPRLEANRYYVYEVHALTAAEALTKVEEQCRGLIRGARWVYSMPFIDRSDTVVKKCIDVKV